MRSTKYRLVSNQLGYIYKVHARFDNEFTDFSVVVVVMTVESATAVNRRRKSRTKTVFFIAILVLLVATFTVLGVSRVIELGSAAFFVVVIAGVLVLLCFFCGLIAYARAKLLSVQNAQPIANQDAIPVFYFLETIHRTVAQDPVPDDEYWLKDAACEEKIFQSEQCPVCLCDMHELDAATGISACCKREIHVKCAQEYFNTVRRVKCVFCRKDLDNSMTSTACPSPVLAAEQTSSV